MFTVQKFIEKNLYGILGTIIFHLLLANVFLFVRISSMKSKEHIEFVVNFEELPEEENVLPKDEKKEFIENELQQFEQQQHRSNIAVNKANDKIAEQLSTEKYIEQVKQEYNIDELFPENEMDENFFPDVNLNKEKKENKPAERKEYSGPTNITYYLENRHDRYLHVPVYKCLGGGKVVLSIVVDQKGYVVSSGVEEVFSERNDPECLIQSAKDALVRSRFNTDYNAANRQKGTITYQFVSQ
jgi:hypothetical protein